MARKADRTSRRTRRRIRQRREAGAASAGTNDVPQFSQNIGVNQRLSAADNLANARQNAPATDSARFCGTDVQDPKIFVYIIGPINIAIARVTSRSATN